MSAVLMRCEAVNLLGAIGDSRSVPALIKALQDKEWGVRYESIEALGKIGDTDAIEPIKLCVIKAKPEEERVRGQGIIVLDEVFNISSSKLREVFLKSNASEFTSIKLWQEIIKLYRILII